MLPRAWLVSPSAGTVTNIRTALWGDAWVSVTLNTASVLERSEAYLPGWRATAVNDITGKVEQLKVMRAGLIEKVDVPQGKWVSSLSLSRALYRSEYRCFCRLGHAVARRVGGPPHQEAPKAQH